MDTQELKDTVHMILCEMSLTCSDIVKNNPEMFGDPGEIASAPVLYDDLAEELVNGSEEASLKLVYYTVGRYPHLANQLIKYTDNDPDVEWVDVITQDYHGNPKNYKKEG